MAYKPLVIQNEISLAWAERKIKQSMLSAVETLAWCDIIVKIEGGNVVHFEQVIKEKPPKQK